MEELVKKLVEEDNMKKQRHQQLPLIMVKEQKKKELRRQVGISVVGASVEKKRELHRWKQAQWLIEQSKTTSKVATPKQSKI